MPKQEEAPKKHLVLKAVLLAVILLAMLVLLDWMHLRRDAKQHYNDLNNGARTVFLAAESYRAAGHTAEEFAGNGKLTEQAGGFASYLLDAGGDLQQGSRYAVICNDKGQIEFVLYAYGSIAEKYLTDPPQAGDGADKDAMLRLLQTPLLWRHAVGVYYPASISAAPENEATTETVFQ